MQTLANERINKIHKNLLHEIKSEQIKARELEFINQLIEEISMYFDVYETMQYVAEYIEKIGGYIPEIIRNQPVNVELDQEFEHIIITCNNITTILDCH